MNKKSLYVLPVCLLAVACVHQENGQGGEAELKSALCDTKMSPEDTEEIQRRCKNPTTSPKQPTVHVNLNGTLRANPPNVCAEPGSTLTIHLTPGPNEIETVGIVPKDLKQIWLMKSNSPDSGQIVINIPEIADGDDTNYTYDYAIYTADGNCVDPRVTVRR